jgi:hypothetical protein
MKLLLLIVVLGWAFTVCACCTKKENRVEPERPKEVAGWKAQKYQGVYAVGEFVLNQGEATDNGKVRVEVIKISPSEPCAGFYDLRSSRRATLRFSKIPSNEILCEDTFVEGSNISLSSTQCKSSLDEFGFDVVSTGGISLQDNWVLVELRGWETK